MIPDPKNPKPSTESYILDVLSKKPRLTTKDLYEFFQKKSRKKITLQGCYKLVKQLIIQRVLVKEGGLISIDASWVHNLVNFTDTLKQIYLQNDSTFTNIVLEEGETKDFHFERPIDMDNFWMHALITIIHYYNDHHHHNKHVFNYNHHSWYQLVRTNSEQTLGEAYHQMGMQWFLVSGSKTFLDTLINSLIENKDFHYTQVEKVTLAKPNYYVVVIDDFIFETTLPNYIHERMEQIYQNVNNISEFNAQDILMLINQPGRTTLTISRNKKRAAKIRDEIKSVFAS